MGLTTTRLRSRFTAKRVIDMRVVIRFIQDAWCIAHAKSYQNAFGREVNSFKTRKDAVEFAESNGCTVEYHEFDQLQTVGE